MDKDQCSSEKTPIGELSSALQSLEKEICFYNEQRTRLNKKVLELGTYSNADLREADKNPPSDEPESLLRDLKGLIKQLNAGNLDLQNSVNNLIRLI